MSQLVGFQKKSFEFEDGKKVEGFFLYILEERQGVTGTATDRVFARTSKLDGYVPVLGDEITINYNRWGKLQSVYKN